MTSTAGTARAPLYYYGWNIVALCMLSQVAANALPVNSYSLFLQDWSAELNTPISTLQLGMGAVGLGGALLAPFVGILADRYSARWLIGTGLAGLALFCLGVSAMSEVWHFLLLYALLLPISMAFGAGVPGNALVARWFVRRLGLAIAITFFGLGAAGIVVPPIVAAIMPEVGWRSIWLSGGLAIALIVLPLVVLVLRPRPTERDGDHYLMGETASDPGSDGDDTLSWRQIFSRRNFWLLIAAYVSLLAIWGGVSQNLAPIATSRGMDQQTAALFLSLFNLAYLAGTLLVGLLSDRFGNRLPFLALALGAAIGGLICAFAQGSIVFAAGVVLVGAGGGFWPLLSAAIAAEFGTRGFGRALGLAAFFVPGAVWAPFAVAKVQEVTGSYTPALIGLAALASLGGAAILFLRERRPGPAVGDDGLAEKATVPAG